MQQVMDLGYATIRQSFRMVTKSLNEIETESDLCTLACCLLDNMRIFNASNWQTLAGLGLRQSPTE